MYDFAKKIGGDKVEVINLVPAGTEPHDWEPSTKDLIEMEKSDIFIYNGAGMEQWVDDVLESLDTEELTSVEASKGIKLLKDQDAHEHDHEHNSENDPHVWLDPQNAKYEMNKIKHVWNSTGNALIIAGNTYKALSQLDKANDAYYMARYDSLCQRIQHTDSLIRQQLSAPEAAKSFMIYHPALSYFARDYGLHQISIEEGGKEPSPAHLKDLIDVCQAENVGVIFVQPEFDKRNAETIAQQTGTKVVPINPLSYDWEEEMLNVAKALAPQAATK